MTVPTVTVKDYALERTYDTPAILLDVREPFEYKMGHVKGALNIPPSKLLSNPPELADVPRDAEICSRMPPTSVDIILIPEARASTITQGRFS